MLREYFTFFGVEFVSNLGFNAGEWIEDLFARMAGLNGVEYSYRGILFSGNYGC
jgi:hypothetical protein